MLSKIFGALRIKSNDEKEAAAIWDDGYMVVDWRTPKLGEKWDSKYLPYWRKWAGEARAIEYSAHYGSIDDKEFWVRAKSKLPNPESNVLALVHAAQYGNLAPFEVLDAEHIVAYAQAFEQVGVIANQGIVHPDVIEWMRAKGHWGQADVERLARNYAFERPHVQTSKVPSLTSGDGRDAATKAFVLDWCTKSLRDNGWSADAQAQFLGSTMMNVNSHYWRDILPDLKKWLHPEVDIVMLAAVSGFDYNFFGDISEHPGLVQLYASVNAFATNPQKLEAWSPVKSLPRTAMEWCIPNGHPALNVLLELTQPGSAMEMYRLAMRVKAGELGTQMQEQWALPDLSV